MCSRDWGGGVTSPSSPTSSKDLDLVGVSSPNCFAARWAALQACFLSFRAQIFSLWAQFASRVGGSLLAVIKYTYLPLIFPNFIQDIEDRCLLLTSSTSFVDLSFQEHQMMEKHHMNQNPCISSICPK
jgi:hypothetical protein